MKFILTIPEPVRICAVLCPAFIGGAWSCYWCWTFLFWWNDLVQRLPQPGDVPVPGLAAAIAVTSIVVGVLAGALIGGALHRIIFFERYQAEKAT